MSFCPHELRAVWRLIVADDLASSFKIVER
jgi:hypothetical protein